LTVLHRQLSTDALPEINLWAMRRFSFDVFVKFFEKINRLHLLFSDGMCYYTDNNLCWRCGDFLPLHCQIFD